MICFAFSWKTCPKMLWSAATCGCLPSVLHSSDLPVAMSGSAWEFLLSVSTLGRIFLLTSMYRAGPWVLQSVSDTILWHVPQIKLAFYSSGFSCLSARFLLHTLLSLPAELTSVLAPYPICLFPFPQSCPWAFLCVCCTASHMCSVSPLLTAFYSPDCLGSTCVMLPVKYQPNSSW